MALAIGFLLFLLGVITFWAWLPWTFHFLQGFVSLSLIFWGAVALLVAYSERKAKKNFADALKDENEEVVETKE